MRFMSPPTDRIASLDQFRGYTVLGMFLVNFVGNYAVTPAILKHHHTYCSYADTIMPQFLFAVGFALRLTFLRRQAKEGSRAAYLTAAKRGLGLVLLGVVVYHLTGRYESWSQLTAKPPGEFLLGTIKRGPFEALVHIGVTCLWVLPVIAAPGWVRVLFAAASGGLHVWLSLVWYYQWNLTPPAGIDGGPLGFLTWAIPAIAGTLAHDWVAAPRDSDEGPVAKLVAAGLILMLLGYALSCLSRWAPPNNYATTGAWWRDQLADPPFAPLSEPWQLNYWVMSQRAGSVSYLVFAAGFAFAVYAAFLVACDRWGWRWGYLDLLGRHALAGYVIHEMVSGAVKPFVPKDSPGWYVALGFAVYLGVTTLFLRHLDRNKLYLRL
jgi:predicted acyltransferase